MNTYSLKNLLDDLPQVGKVCWIGLRPGKKEKIRVFEQVSATISMGLIGDHYSGRSGKRHVTLIQQEHLSVIAACLGLTEIHPSQLRRNIVVSGVNLLALKDKNFKVGSALLEFTGLCHPCSAMQRELGPGGYNAVRGHGGITARVIEDGLIRLGDTVQAER